MVKVIEEFGQKSVQEAIHLPVNGESRGWESHSLKTLSKMITRGDEHAKTERLLQASLKITAPRYIWQELDTYNVGVTPGSSTSTMYTLMKQLKSVNNYLYIVDLFEHGTPYSMIEAFYNSYKDIEEFSLTTDEKLRKLKKALPEGFLQTRVKQFSYQTLRRIYNQRKHHRLKWWNDFFDILIPQLEQQTLIEKTWNLDGK